MSTLIIVSTWVAIAVVIASAVQLTWLADWWRSRTACSFMLIKFAIILFLTTRLLSVEAFHDPSYPQALLSWLALAGRCLIVVVYAQRMLSRELRRRRLSQPPRVLSVGGLRWSTRQHEDAG